MRAECPCSNHQHQSALSLLEQQQRHVVSLLLSSFTSPFKILHMLDPTQADSFQRRNPSAGCCPSPHINIPHHQLTPTEKLLQEMLTPQQVLLRLDEVLSFCWERMENIVAKGKEDGLKVDREVQKFLIDKVLEEGSNLYFLEQLKKKVREEGDRVSKEMGLWATPASWEQRYPGVELQFISGPQMAEIMGRGWTVIRNALQNKKRLREEVCLLEKDGKFQRQVWGKDANGSSEGQKVLSDPEKYASMQTSDSKYLFPALREAVMLVSALPFELNKKANLFCAVSPHLHLCYSQSIFRGSWGTGEARFTVLVGVSGEVRVRVGGSEGEELGCGDMLIVSNAKQGYELECGCDSMLMRNYIEIVGK